MTTFPSNPLLAPLDTSWHVLYNLGTERDVMEPEKQFLTVAEAARVFGVSPRTLRRYVKRKLLPGVQLGRRIFIPVEALRRLLEVGDKPKGCRGEGEHK